MPDVIFLDVMFPEGNGISMAKEISGRIANCKLVLITSSNDFALQGYEIHAYDYLLKPLKKEVVFSLLDAFAGVQGTVVTINMKGVSVGIKSPDITYIESSKHTVILHSKGKEFLAYGKLDEFEELLKNEASFIRCHQSYLINLSYVSEIKSRYFIMQDGVSIPMRKSGAAGFKRAYYSFVMGSGK